MSQIAPPYGTPFFISNSSTNLTIPWTSFFDNLYTNTTSSNNLVIGDTVQAYDAGLASIAALNSIGILCAIDTDSFTTRSLSVGDGLSISTTTGASSNFVISLDSGSMETVTTVDSSAYALISSGGTVKKVLASTLTSTGDETISRSWMGV